jgi:CubicO group peptidase (beta-lactamase class C family)
MFSFQAFANRFLIILVMNCFFHLTGLFSQEMTPLKEVQFDRIEKLKFGNILDKDDLEAFFDVVIPFQLNSKHIAGAVVAVVLGDRVVFTKGYGYSDVEANKKVDPEKTIFRIASVSKLFTWIAVMQLVEEGKLDLDTDVNHYLSTVKIPDTYEQPITLKHLLTHTSGFDDIVINFSSYKAEDVLPLTEVLKVQMPIRVRPPGVIACYSNHGVAIAGEVISNVSGLSWEDYIEQRILKPLGMKHSMVRQPDVDKLPTDLSKGYSWKQDHFEKQGFVYIPAAPAGCMGLSALDAAKFMIAYLQEGKLGSERILKPETVQLMREPLFRHHSKTGAMCYGFWEQEWNGQRVLGHEGAFLWFYAMMQWIPEHDIGIFVSYNTDTAGGESEVLFEAFMQRYFSQPISPVIKVENGFAERGKKMIGEYGLTRYSHSSLTKLSALLGAYTVSLNNDDTLTISIGGKSNRYVEIEPFVFRELNGQKKMVFQEDENGEVRYLFSAEAPPLSAIRREWYELSSLHWGLLGTSFAVFLSSFLFWPVIAFSKRKLQKPRIMRTQFPVIASCIAWFLSVAGILFIAGLVMVFANPFDILFGVTPLLRTVMIMAQISAVLMVFTLIGCVLAWKNQYWGLIGRLHYTMVALAGIAFTWFLYYWNLLTFHV